MAGDKSDPTAFSVLMKKNGKISNHQAVDPWNAADSEAHWGFYRWFAVAPIMGTSDIFCAVALRRDKIEVYGYIISGN